MAQDVRRIEVEGVGIRVEQGGVGDGPPIVFLHGWLRSSQEWRFLFPKFQEVARCVALDLPGCGGSDVPADAPYDVPWLAAKVLGALDALGLGEVRLFTHGLGAAVGLRLCIDHPQRVRCHVAVSAPTWPNLLMGLRGRIITRSPLGKLGVKAFLSRSRVRRMLLDRQYHEPLRLTDEVLDSVMTALERPGAKDAAYKLLLADIDPGIADDFPRLSTPTSLIFGYSDRVNLIDLARRMEKEVENTRLFLIPNTGYMAIEERPLSVAIYAAKALGVPLPQGIDDGHPTPEDGDF